jgi:HD-GYP domain-containing protein (c-di-GMP phosphodiesterase class II)
MEKNKRSLEEVKELFNVAKSISSALDVDTLLKRIDAVAEKMTDAEASSILLLDEDHQTLSFKLASGEKGGVVQKFKVKLGQGIAGIVAKDRKPLMINDVSADARFDNFWDKASGFITKSIVSVPMIVDNELIGVMEALNKKDGGCFTENDLSVLESLAALTAVSIHNARMVEDQRNFFANMLEILVSSIESRDPHLGGHSWNVAELATTIGRQLEMGETEYKNLHYGALLHDIGLIKIRGNLTLADGVVTVRERDVESNHPRIGADIVCNINLLKGAAPIIRNHHENYDGTGYPDALAGKNISLGARIVAVAEAIEEMRMSGFPKERITQMLMSGKETRFDPELVDLFIKEFF